MHTLEDSLLTIAGIVSLIALFFALRKRPMEASFIFLLSQFFSWILGLAVVQSSMIAYPVHEFAKANSTSFLFEYCILPVTAVFFVLRYPSSHPLARRLFYFAGIISVFTVVEVVVERYTAIIDYITWTWYWTWLSMSLVLYVVLVIYRWFFRAQKNVFSL